MIFLKSKHMGRAGGSTPGGSQGVWGMVNPPSKYGSFFLIYYSTIVSLTSVLELLIGLIDP